MTLGLPRRRQNRQTLPTGPNLSARTDPSRRAANPERTDHRTGTSGTFPRADNRAADGSWEPPWIRCGRSTRPRAALGARAARTTARTASSWLSPVVVVNSGSRESHVRANPTHDPASRGPPRDRRLRSPRSSGPPGFSCTRAAPKSAKTGARQIREIPVNADVAQLVEHFTRNEGVPGSSPGVGSSYLQGKCAPTGGLVSRTHPPLRNSGGAPARLACAR